MSKFTPDSYAATHVPGNQTLQKRIQGALLAALLLLCAGCGRPPADSTGAPEHVPPPGGSSISGAGSPANASVTSELGLPAAVAKILSGARRTGSLVEHCRCTGSAIEEIHTVPAGIAQQPMPQAFNAIAQRYPQIKWREYAQERVRVVDTSARTGLLNVRIKKFLVIEDRPPHASLPALWGTEEVRRYVQKHRIRLARTTQQESKIIKTAPVVIQMKNATVAEILDRIVDSYRPGGTTNVRYHAWAYRECRSQSGTMVDIAIF